MSECLPEASWYRLEPGDSPLVWEPHWPAGTPLVMTGWAAWLQDLLATTSDDEVLRAAWRDHLAALVEVERATRGEALLILDEMGCGIVPMAPEARRLRDLNGWLTQEVAARSRAVWQVRHGLVRRLDTKAGPGQGMAP